MSDNTPSPEKLTLLNERGRVMQESTVLDGELQGETLVYDAGQLAGRLRFRDGKQDGESVYFSAAGEVMVKANYREGQLDGESQYFDPGGKLVRRALYKDGMLEGRAIEYYPSGKVREVQHYRDNLLEGELLRYSEEGKLVERLCFWRGRQVPCSALPARK